MDILFKIMAGFVFLFFVGFSCEQAGEEQEEVVVTSAFDGSGDRSQWAGYQSQNKSLLNMKFSLSDFTSIAADSIDNTAVLSRLQSEFSAFSARSYTASVSGIDVSSFETGDAMLANCLLGLMDTQTMTTSHDEFMISFEVDASSCVAHAFSDLAYDTATFTFSFQYYGQCYGSDLSSLNGTTLLEIRNTEQSSQLPFCAQEVSRAINVGMDFGLTFTPSNAAGTLHLDLDIKLAHVDSNNRSCQKFATDAGILFENGCSDYNVTSTSIELKDLSGSVTSAETSVDFSKITSNDLVQAASGDQWYAAGKKDITINNWTGSMTYTGGAINPTFSLTGGGENLTGGLSADGGVSLFLTDKDHAKEGQMGGTSVSLLHHIAVDKVLEEMKKSYNNIENARNQ